MLTSRLFREFPRSPTVRDMESLKDRRWLLQMSVLKEAHQLSSSTRRMLGLLVC